MAAVHGSVALCCRVEAIRNEVEQNPGDLATRFRQLTRRSMARWTMKLSPRHRRLRLDAKTAVPWQIVDISEESCLVKTWDGEQTDDTGSQD